MKVAVACSGLGHIHRGIEAWAEDLAAGLADAGVRVTLFRGAGPKEPWAEVIPVLRREQRITKRATQVFRQIGGWRYGCGSAYEIEQTSFSLGLWRKIRRHYDVVHVQDSVIGLHLTRLHKLGLSRPKVVVGNGIGLHPHGQRHYSYLQHLCPAQHVEWQPHAVPGQRAWVIPNFIDTERFRPACSAASRAAWGIPENAFVVLAVAALKMRFKRLDYLVQEFAAFASRTARPITLVLAGAREEETDELTAMARKCVGDRVRILENIDRSYIHTLYPIADVFTIPALNEVFGIAFIEAMASGIPIVAHDTPTMRWVGGPAGAYGDFTKQGELARVFASLLSKPAFLSQLAASARPHVLENFSKRAVIPQMVDLYHSITSS